MVDLRTRLFIALAFFSLCLAACLTLFVLEMNEPAMFLGGMATTAGAGLMDMLRARADKNGRRASDPAGIRDSLEDPDKTPREGRSIP